MSTRVQLYVYDLSNGLAGQLSMQMTGRQIEGIWHTSVVVFGKEIFYGQGISTTPPGQSHLGQPLRVIEMGETAIDEETFEQYLMEIREQYTPEKYHLLDFNCNTFSSDCVDFLTGQSIPEYIKSLPADFLSTPFGAALRPSIDAMFRRGAVSEIPTPPPEATRAAAAVSPNPALATSLLQSVAAHASTHGLSRPSGSYPTPAPTSPPTPSNAMQVRNCSDPTFFQSLLRNNRAVIAFFTSANCGPCRMIEPVFEDLAKNKSKPGAVAFVKVDLAVGMSAAVAAPYGVRATPSFIFILDGGKTHEFRGANVPELRTQVDLLIYAAFPPHHHTTLSLPAVESISLNPILFTQVPKLDTLLAKLNEFIDSAPSWTSPVTQAQVKQVLAKTIIPFLKASFTTPPPPQPPTAPFDSWSALAASLVSNLPISNLFPLVDIWRVALLNPKFSEWNSNRNASKNTIGVLLSRTLESKGVPRNYQLTVLRMLSNAFSNTNLARQCVVSMRSDLTSLLVSALLHEDAAVRTAAASLAFNVASYLQKLRLEKMKSSCNSNIDPEEDAEWEVEIVSAILEAIRQENTSGDSVHRLVASLALLLRFSPFMEHLTALMDVLQSRSILTAKLSDGDGTCKPKPEVRKLISEVAEKLCPP